MSKTRMVSATKYRLLIPISVKNGEYRNTGKPEEREEITTKIVSRAYVEERNAGKHHEFWIINEVESERLFGEGGEQSKVIQKQAAEKKNKAMGMGDLVAALKGETQPVDNSELEELKAKLAKAESELKAQKESKKDDRIPADDEQKSDEPCIEWGVDKLRAYCDENKIKYHHLTKEAGLLELINEAK